MSLLVVEVEVDDCCREAGGAGVCELVVVADVECGEGGQVADGLGQGCEVRVHDDEGVQEVAGVSEGVVGYGGQGVSQRSEFLDGRRELFRGDGCDFVVLKSKQRLK